MDEDLLSKLRQSKAPSGALLAIMFEAVAKAAGRAMRQHAAAADERISALEMRMAAMEAGREQVESSRR